MVVLVLVMVLAASMTFLVSAIEPNFLLLLPFFFLFMFSVRFGLNSNEKCPQNSSARKAISTLYQSPNFHAFQAFHQHFFPLCVFLTQCNVNVNSNVNMNIVFHAAIATAAALRVHISKYLPPYFTFNILQNKYSNQMGCSFFFRLL